MLAILAAHHAFWFKTSSSLLRAYVVTKASSPSLHSVYQELLSNKKDNLYPYLQIPIFHGAIDYTNS